MELRQGGLERGREASYVDPDGPVDVSGTIRPWPR